MQSVLRNIERQIQDFQRQQQQQDLQSELEHHHKLPVDIQIGDQVILQDCSFAATPTFAVTAS
jgi:hypothetical protein